jgi:hypothetical protein
MKLNLNVQKINLGSLWFKLWNLRISLLFCINVVLAIILTQLIYFDDVESIIIFDILFIFFFIYFLLKDFILKQIHYNRNQLICYSYLNFFFKKHLLLNTYVLILRHIYINFLINELSVLFNQMLEEETNFQKLISKISLQESTQILLNKSINNHLIKYNEKLQIVMNKIHYKILKKYSCFLFSVKPPLKTKHQ